MILQHLEIIPTTTHFADLGMLSVALEDLNAIEADVVAISPRGLDVNGHTAPSRKERDLKLIATLVTEKNLRRYISQQCMAHDRRLQSING